MSMFDILVGIIAAIAGIGIALALLLPYLLDYIERHDSQEGDDL